MTRGRGSLRAYLAKAAVVAMAIVGGSAAFLSRFHFGLDEQVHKCIPGYSVYLIDRADKALEKGKTYAFEARGLEPFFPEGRHLVKFLRAEAGDTVEITPDGRVLVNGEFVTGGLRYAERLGRAPADFTGKGQLKPGEYWFLGISEFSFDSRYWGAVKEDQIIGRAYPLF